MHQLAFLILIDVAVQQRCFSQVVDNPAERAGLSNKELAAFIGSYSKQERSDTPVTGFLYATADLNDDGRDEVIVYFDEDPWCGSGGCTALVLSRFPSLKMISKITITRLAFSVLASTSHGWHDLTVTVRGGGITKPYESQLRFDGRSYPSNSSIPASRPLKGKIGKRTLVFSRGVL